MIIRNPFPAPPEEDVENASQMSTADRMTMIEGMVSGLAEKLQKRTKEPGWLEQADPFL